MSASMQGDVAAFKDYTAEDARGGGGGGGGAPNKQATPQPESKKAEGKQEAAPQQKSQEQSPAAPQPKQPSSEAPPPPFPPRAPLDHCANAAVISHCSATYCAVDHILVLCCLPTHYTVDGYLGTELSSSRTTHC